MQTHGNLPIEPFGRLYDKIQLYLPNLFQALLIFISGLILGLAVKFILSWILRMTRIDDLAERTGAIDLLRKSGIKHSFSGMMARAIAGLIIILFTCVSIVALDIPVTNGFIEKFLLYLPNVFAAGLVLIFGYILANFLGRAALIASVNAGIRISGALAKAIKIAIYLLAATMALEQLGIGGETVIIAFAVVLGGIVLSLALAFGLGARDIARKYLEEKIDRLPERDWVGHL